MKLQNMGTNDIIGWAPTRQEAAQFVTEAKIIAKEAGIKIQRWKTNDLTLQEQLDDE